MKNWSTDTNAFESPHKKRVWELVQGINYGFDGEEIHGEEVRRFWPEIVPHVLPESRRLWEVWLWSRIYSLPITRGFWQRLPTAVI
ncbi:MAG: hypothetical protein AAB457_01000 [Patescibacteria group bacterium]